MRWVVRAPTKDQLMVLRNRVKACFEFVWENDVYSCDVLIEVDSGAALSTSCGLKITMGVPYYDLLQNGILGKSESSPDFVQYLSLLCFFLPAASFSTACTDLGMDIFDHGFGASTDFVRFPL